MTYVDLFTHLLRAEIAVWDSLDATLKQQSAVSLPQFQALAAIDDIGGGARVQDVSTAMTITVGATSKLIDRLERDGLAERGSNPHDRRSSIIELTDQGSRSLAGARVVAEEHLRSLLSEAFPAERARALSTDLVEYRQQVIR